MTEREEKLNFMATYLEDKEYDNPWKVVAVLDLYKAYFDEDTPEEEIQNILEKITVDEWDDGEITFEKEDGTEETYRVYNDDDIDDMLYDARQDYIMDERHRIPEDLKDYVDWTTLGEDRYGSIYDLFDDSDIIEFSCETDPYTTKYLYITIAW